MGSNYQKKAEICQWLYMQLKKPLKIILTNYLGSFIYYHSDTQVMGG